MEERVIQRIQKIDLNEDSENDQIPHYKSFIQDLNICKSIVTLPQGIKLLNTEVCYVVKGVEKPRGITMLLDGNIVVGDRGENSAKICDANTGKMIKKIIPGKNFKSPSHMTTLSDGRLVIGDDNGVQLFDEEGNYIQDVAPTGVYGKRYGVASDMKGNILVINTNPTGIADCVTKKGETDILRINFEKGTITEKIELVDVIENARQSKCRFLHCDGSKVYVVDLGLDQVYVLTLGETAVRKFGKKGKGPGEFSEPAGLVTDSYGNMIIADAGNHRLQVFDKKRNYKGFVKVSASIQRPSGIYLDIESNVLYILNLRGNSFVKTKLL